MSPLRAGIALLVAGGLVWAGLPLASLVSAKPDRLLALGLPDAEGPVMAELALKLLVKASGPPQVLPGIPAPADPPWHAACN